MSRSSAASSSASQGPPEVHRIIRGAASGELPPWTVAGPERRAHMNRVSALLDDWAGALDLPPPERIRWRAAGRLHDALREEDPDCLRGRVPPSVQALPAPLLHGPAAAERLRIDGVRDGELLRAIAFHTVGDPGFGTLGRALYAADFLEPGRSFEPEWRGALRARMPRGLEEVVREIVGARIGHLLKRGMAVLPRTVAFWNVLAEEPG